MDFLAGIFALIIMFYIFMGLIILLGVVIVIRIIAAIVNSIREVNSIASASANTGYTSGSTTTYSPTTTSNKNDTYNINMDYAIPPKETRSAQPAKSGDFYTVVGVSFNKGGKVYDYLCDDADVEVGDLVFVETSRGLKEMEVLSVNKTKKSDLQLELGKYKKAYNITSDTYDDIDIDAIDREIDEVLDDDAEVIDFTSYYDKEEEERMAEPYICPECGDSYDGIYCENCGFEPEIGYEEISNDERFVEDFTAIAMFDAEEKRMRAEKEEKLFGGFGGGFDDEFEDDF